MHNDTTYNTKFSELPDVLPIFPIDGALLLPGGQLPLNIFEDRYLAMVDDALKSNRLIGMIQPKINTDDNALQSNQVSDLENVGCVGKIVHFQHLPDGRYFILLKGLWRFSIKQELDQTNGFRRILPLWSDYADDHVQPKSLDLDRDKLRDVMEIYLKQNDIEIDCSQLDGADDTQLITALSMICPMTSIDKQALLEASHCKERARMFMVLLDMAIRGDQQDIVH